MRACTLPDLQISFQTREQCCHTLVLHCEKLKTCLSLLISRALESWFKWLLFFPIYLWGTATSPPGAFFLFPSIHRHRVLRSALQIWEQDFSFGLCSWAGLLDCGWTANPWCPAMQEAGRSFSCTKLGMTKFVRTSGGAGMDAALSNWLHLEWIHASQCLQMLFWGSLSKRQLPEDKLVLKTFGSCSKFTCQRKLCVPFLRELLETLLLLLSAPLCFLKQVTIVFTRQEICSLASFFLHQGCFFCFLAFPFTNITGFCCQLLYLPPYHAAFQQTAFAETYFTSVNPWWGNFTSSKLDNCTLKSSSIVCRALLDTSLAAGSWTPGIIIVCRVHHLMWSMTAFDTEKRWIFNLQYSEKSKLSTHIEGSKNPDFTQLKQTLKQAIKGLVLSKHGIILIYLHIQGHTHTVCCFMLKQWRKVF